MAFIVYEGQDVLQVDMETNYDLTEASAVSILYTTPSLISGEWAGIKEGSIIRYTMPSSFYESGEWKFQAKIEIAAGTLLGRITTRTMDVREEITP